MKKKLFRALYGRWDKRKKIFLRIFTFSWIKFSLFVKILMTFQNAAFFFIDTYQKLICTIEIQVFSNFSCRFLNPTIFSNSNHNCSNVLDVRNLQERVSKIFCNQNLFWHFAIWINYSSDLKNFSLEFKKFFSITRTFFFAQ